MMWTAEILDRILDVKIRNNDKFCYYEQTKPADWKVVVERKTKPWRGFNLKMQKTRTVVTNPPLKTKVAYYPFRIRPDEKYYLEMIPGYHCVVDFAYPDGLPDGVAGCYKYFFFIVDSNFGGIDEVS